MNTKYLPGLAARGEPYRKDPIDVERQANRRAHGKLVHRPTANEPRHSRKSRRTTRHRGKAASHRR